MVLGLGLILQLDSRDSVLTVPRHVISGFSSNILENFLASSSLQQFQVKPNMNNCEWKGLSFWYQIPSKTKPQLFNSCFNRSNDRAKFNYWGWRKTLLLFLLYSLTIWILRPWRFLKTVTLAALTKKYFYFDKLRNWKKTAVNRRLLIDFLYPAN